MVRQHYLLVRHVEFIVRASRVSVRQSLEVVVVFPESKVERARMKTQIAGRISATLVCVAISFVVSSSVGFAQKKTQVFTPAEIKRSKTSVIEQLRELFKPSDPKDLEKLAEPEPKPYVRVVPGTDGKSTLIYKLRYVQARDLVSPLESIVSRASTVECSEQKNLIVIHDDTKKIPELIEAIEKMDIVVPQILVEARVVEVFLQSGTERDVRLEYRKIDRGDGTVNSGGFNLTAPSQNRQPLQGTKLNWTPYSPGTTTSRIAKNLDLYIRWLQNTRNARILSAPNIIVDLGATASIVTGEDLPIQETQVTGNSVTTSTRYKRIGVKLNVTPDLINSREVRLKVFPEVTSVIRYEQFTQNNLTFSTPVIAIRNINTELSMRDGEIIILGGLYSTEKMVTKRRTPYLSDLPLIGELFTALDETNIQKQLVFFLKMHIMKRGDGIFAKQDLEKTSGDMRKAADIIESSDTIFPINNSPYRQKELIPVKRRMEEDAKKSDEGGTADGTASPPDGDSK